MFFSQSSRYLINIRKSAKRYLFNWVFVEEKLSFNSANNITVFPIQLCNIHYWSEVVHAWRVIRLSCFIMPISRIRLYARLLMRRNNLVGRALDWRSKYLQFDSEFRHRLSRLLSKRNDTFLEASGCGFHGILSISRWNKYLFFFLTLAFISV